MAAAMIETFLLQPGGGMPNNGRLPLVVFRQALSGTALSPDGCTALFRANGWQNTWLNGVFPYWHYHLRSHEVLGCVGGGARVGFGGDDGIEAEFNAGDVVVIPAGVGHKRLAQRPGFLVVGGYPPGQDGAVTDPDTVDLAAAIRQAGAVPVPQSDPVGRADGLLAVWA
ncbi:MAG: cupin domain-containing protein [Alphaproteobacteria bacterium]